MTTTFTYNSQRLGDAFLEELKELGYKYKDYGKDSCLAMDTKDKVIWHEHKDYTGDGQTFHLEREWDKGLDYAKNNIKKSFKKGQWVEVDMSGANALVKYSENKLCKGFGYADKWADSGISIMGKGFITKADPDVVKERLIQEALERGFGDGVTIISAQYPKDGYKTLKSHGDWEYYPFSDTLYFGGTSVYSQGRWAEIIEVPKDFFGWDTEITDDHVIIGCKSFDRDTFEKIVEGLYLLDNQINVRDITRELERSGLVSSTPDDLPF